MAAGILVGETDADAKNRFAAEFRRQVVEPFARKHGSMACGDMVNDKKNAYGMRRFFRGDKRTV